MTWYVAGSDNETDWLVIIFIAHRYRVKYASLNNSIISCIVYVMADYQQIMA